MSRSTDSDCFFQTTDSLADSARKAEKSKNKNGSPIQLSSKILALIADPTNSDRVFVAEAAGTVRRIVLETNNWRSYILRGPNTPLTSLALSLRHPKIYAGSWDKTIWSWDINTREPGTRFKGHTDFVKCVLTLPLPDLELLVSGSSDAMIILWNASTGEKLQILKGHSMAVLALAIDPLSYPDSWPPPTDKASTDDSLSKEKCIILFSGSSDSAILRWSITLPQLSQPLAARLPANSLLPHATSLSTLLFPPTSTDLYTSSLDGTALRLSRHQNWTPDTIFRHGDYVRSVAVSAGEKYILTAGRDEDIKVWSGETGEMVGRFVGHFGEITGVVVLEGRWRGEDGREERAVSTSIDGTVRRWVLSEAELERGRAEREGEEDGRKKEEERVKEVEGGLTAEEEAELAALMGD